MIKVMLVDDEEKTRRLIKLLINKSLGITIVGEANNGIEGLEMIKAKCPDVVITDIRMPLMDGFEFSKSALKHNKDLMIIIISAYEEFEYAQKAIKLGISDFLLKPIKKNELNEGLEKVIERIKQRKINYGVQEEEGRAATLIEQVIQYILQNLGDSTLSLTTIAQHFFVNPSYLSRQFKSEVGLPFIEYLTKLRMEKAIWYLEETDKKAYEIAERVGISDAAYFGKCFKKYKGVSIHYYRKLIREHRK